MSITLSFKVEKGGAFVLVNPSAATVAGTAEAMKRIFEARKIFDRKTTEGAIPSWDEFSAEITVANHATNFRLRLTSQNNEFVYDLRMVTPKIAETLVNLEVLKNLRSPPPIEPLPPQSAPVSYDQGLNVRLSEKAANSLDECAPPLHRLPIPLPPPSSAPNPTNSEKFFIVKLGRFFYFHAYQLFCGLNKGFKLIVSFLFKTGADAPNGRSGRFN